MTDSRRVALSNLFDDAGMFPPTGKGLAGALVDHRRHRASDLGWLAGRFLVPSSRIADYAAACAADDDWTASVVVQPSQDRSLSGVVQDVFAYAASARIEALELRLPAGDPQPTLVSEVSALMEVGMFAAAAELWLEIPLTSPSVVYGWLDVLAEARSAVSSLEVGAKIRCGGPVAAAFPSVEAVAGFVSAARARGVPFKATAGLHHPFGRWNEQLGVREFGFVNLLAAAAVDEPDCARVLYAHGTEVERDATELRWGSITVSWAQLAEVRTLFASIGSCSLTEPADDLTACGLLVTAAHGAVS
jgi:hypothetical protein